MAYPRIEESVESLKWKCQEPGYKTSSAKFTRKRKLPLTDIAWYLAMHKGRASGVELDSYLKEKTGGYGSNITKQAFSKQRQHLKPEIFIDLAKDYLKSFYQKTPEEVRKYKGHVILAVDGSIFEIPDTKELREEYMSHSCGSKDRARARVSMLYDLENGFIVDALISGCGRSEDSLCRGNIANSKSVLDLKNSIIIFDRGYPGVELMLCLEEIGTKYIFRLPSRAYERERQGMQPADEWVDISLGGGRQRSIKSGRLMEAAMEKKHLRCRLGRVALSTGETEHLLSNIEKDVISEEEMGDAYFKRWQVETGYGILKNKMRLENFTGRTKIAIEQDFHAGIYTYNLLRDIQNAANEKVREESRGKSLKYEYKPNINILAGVLKNILIAVMFVEGDDEKERLYRTIVDKAKRNLVAVRPGRSFERKEYSGKNKYRTNIRRNM